MSVTAAAPAVLALDFDGVLCDGLKEYFQTAWRTYCRLWLSEVADPPAPPDGLAERFYPLRPVIETGWEMPLLLRALLRGIPDADLARDWEGISRQLVAEEGLDCQQLSIALDGLRDAWIREDADAWLGLHRFYPGAADRLRSALAGAVEVYIVTTKEARFVRELLAREGVEMPEARIFGKGVRRPKAETLKILRDRHLAPGNDPGAAPEHGAAIAPGTGLWFVEDLLKSLHKVAAEPDLAGTALFLADWGYNTDAHREAARQSDRVALLSLDRFVGPFEGWGRGEAIAT